MAEDTVNTQDRNVGNRGDVLKHRLLVDSLGLLAQLSSDRSLIYVDTHAYAAEADLPTPQAAGIAPRDPNDIYYLIEEDYVERGRYLCSPGLALAVSACFLDAFFVISEKMRTNLQALQEYYTTVHDSLEPRSWFSREFDSRNLSAAVKEAERLHPRQDRLVFVLVDPFTYSADPGAVTKPVAAVTDVQCPVLVQIFNYGERTPADVVPTGWTAWHKDDHPYYHVLIANSSMIDLLGAEAIASLIAGIE